MLFSSTYGAVFAARLRMEYAALGNIAQSLTSLALMSAVALSGGGLVRMLIAYDAGFLVNSASVCSSRGSSSVRRFASTGPWHA